MFSYGKPKSVDKQGGEAVSTKEIHIFTHRCGAELAHAFAIISNI